MILCTEGNAEHIEYLMLEEDSPIKVAQYYTKLLDKKLLSEKKCKEPSQSQKSAMLKHCLRRKIISNIKISSYLCRL